MVVCWNHRHNYMPMVGTIIPAQFYLPLQSMHNAQPLTRFHVCEQVNVIIKHRKVLSIALETIRHIVEKYAMQSSPCLDDVTNKCAIITMNLTESFLHCCWEWFSLTTESFFLFPLVPFKLVKYKDASAINQSDCVLLCACVGMQVVDTSCRLLSVDSMYFYL